MNFPSGFSPANSSKPRATLGTRDFCCPVAAGTGCRRSAPHYCRSARPARKAGMSKLYQVSRSFFR
ncbi:hypothetical protein A6M21_01935 [Desulfotomaculum copahuensis]|uniref:Uncharacterized protein n=1 Tax=Desulfotomaculum copahuensis TaxID=1838280 RepID=A0A1B7LKH7_9FIRM|nr:hypothetical protein A6M21_01935 [Desulfotomaculum copahuensis]